MLTARDGYDALEKLDSLERPCLILLDLMMPRMSGLEFLDHLSRQPDLEDVVVGSCPRMTGCAARPNITQGSGQR